MERTDSRDGARGAKSSPTQRPRALRRGAQLLTWTLACAVALTLQAEADAGPTPQVSEESSAQTASGPTAIASSCTLGGHRLAGRVKVVDSFPDLKVKIVDAFPDLKVRWVDAFPDSCGRWQRVDAFPDLTIQFVDAFPDLTIREVDSFPGLP